MRQEFVEICGWWLEIPCSLHSCACNHSDGIQENIWNLNLNFYSKLFSSSKTVCFGYFPYIFSSHFLTAVHSVIVLACECSHCKREFWRVSASCCNIFIVALIFNWKITGHWEVRLLLTVMLPMGYQIVNFDTPLFLSLMCVFIYHHCLLIMSKCMTQVWSENEE